MHRLTISMDDKLYDALLEKQAKMQKEKKRSISMSEIIRIKLRECLHVPDTAISIAV